MLTLTSRSIGRTVLAVFAHPDDESLACGGTLASLVESGSHTVLLCASRGERGFCGDPAMAVGTTLGSLRTRELHAAAGVLRLGQVSIHDHPDGSLRWADGTEFQREIVDTIRRYNVDAVITFDRDGLYWHPDHIGVHERTTAAVLSLGSAAPALYYVTMRHGAMRQFVDRAIQGGWVNPRRGFWAIPADAFGYGADCPSFCIDVWPWVRQKLAALACHRTQLGASHPFSLIHEEDARVLLAFEYFRRASVRDPRDIESRGSANPSSAWDGSGEVIMT